MAPFSQDRGRSRGSRGQTRRPQHGQSTRGRGKGRGKGDSRARGGHWETFYSTRVKEKPQNLAGSDPDDLDEGKDDVQEPTEPSSNSEEEEFPESTAKPYNLLLQSLSANVQQGEPPSRKRKLNDVLVPSEPQMIGDEVDEAEGHEEADESAPEDTEDDEMEDNHDPFAKHLAGRKEAELSQSIANVKNNEWQNTRSGDAKRSCLLKIPGKLNINTHALIGLDGAFLKEKLKEPFQRILPGLDFVSRPILSSTFSYQDILFPQRTTENAEILRQIICLHSLNHVFKTRDRVIKNNDRFAKADTNVDLEIRDQGFTRPKVLIILPTRNSCVKYVDTITSICIPEQQENKKRFQDLYVSNEDDVSDDKPKDFRELFASNDDDMFRLGMKFTRKTVKYFSQFYSSDIILASPLGLRMALGTDDIKKQDHDFLSSIEIVAVDQADAMPMQNWEHVEHIFEHLNLQPKEARGCDFSRVREWYLDGNAKYLRQTIVLSAFNFPSLNKLYINQMLNITGKAKFSKKEDGAMIDLGLSAKQTFSRLEYSDPVSEPNARFKHFSTAVLPSLTKDFKRSGGAGQGVLIFLPSYAEFVRVRNYLATSSATQNISFGSISEYSSTKDVARARSHFLSGRHSMLLYTERAHHFRRYHLKGVKKVIMYGLPENPIFYKEVVDGFLSSSVVSAKLDIREASVRALFSMLDLLKLERIVGSSRYIPMLKDKAGDTFDFM